MTRLFALLFFSFALVPFSTLQAQVGPDARRPLIGYGYGTATAAQPELGQGHQLGASWGLMLQRSRLLAVDVRGVMLSARVPIHTYIAESGPRMAPSFSRHWQPYAEFLAGYGHSEYRAPASLALSKGFGFAWTAAFGLDLHLKYGLDWRVAEYSYNQISAGNGSASPTMLNTGVVFRFKSPRGGGRTM